MKTRKNTTTTTTKIRTKIYKSFVNLILYKWNLKKERVEEEEEVEEVE